MSQHPARAQRPPAITLPAFAPVPRRCNRHDGWTPARQRAFIEALATSGSVRSAAQQTGMTPESAYQLRRQPGAEEFREAWQAALDLGMQRVEDVAMDRALNGVEVPVYSYGKLVGTRIVYNDRLLMFLLRNRAPERFAPAGARAMSALDRTTLARMKTEWREQWEREQGLLAAEQETIAIESLEQKLASVREREEAMMSPRTLALRDAFRRAQEEDRRAFCEGAWEAPAEEDESAIPLPPPGMILPGDRRPVHDDGWELLPGPEDERPGDAEEGK